MSTQSGNEHAGNTVIGEQATNDQVQHAADMADGHDDGIDQMPENDIQQVLLALRQGDKLTALWMLALTIKNKGVAPDGSAGDWATLTLELGEDAIAAAAAISKIVAAIGL